MNGKIDSICIIDMSGIYKNQEFWKNRNIHWIRGKHITGTNCYCDDVAREELRCLLTEDLFHGIHYIDSGNYHYLSAIWLEHVKTPFQLLVFDNHTDMQLPAFGGILSCGGWIGEVIENNPYLENVFLLGPDEEAFGMAEGSFQEKTIFYSRESLKHENDMEIKEYFSKLNKDLPLYISIDKDILCSQDAQTTWSQGDVTLEKLEQFLDEIYHCYIEVSGRILAIDICGECAPESTERNFINDIANERLLNIISGWGLE